MKHILKLTIFMVLGLLLVSCSKSSSNSSSENNTGMKLQGVLEKGKATDALCEISTLNGKVYSKSNHIDNGGYVATVPAGAFDVTCKIKNYIDDITGKSVDPAIPITLEAISFAKEGKDKTVNVNVLTNVVAKELKKSKNKITDEKSFDKAKEDAKDTALQGILSTQSTIENIDTLSLQDKGILAQVSLAVQKQLKKDPSITIDQALTKAKTAKAADSIANQDVNSLNPNAIAISTTNIQPPTPTKQPTRATITLTRATIGGELVMSPPIDIDASNPVIFSIPTNDLSEVTPFDSVYIASDKSDKTVIKLESGKNNYTANDVKNLFKNGDETNFIICVVTTMPKPLGLEANKQCNDAGRKAIFTATAIAVPSGTENPASSASGITRTQRNRKARTQRNKKTRIKF